MFDKTIKQQVLYLYRKGYTVISIRNLLMSLSSRRKAPKINEIKLIIHYFFKKKQSNGQKRKLGLNKMTISSVKYIKVKNLILFYYKDLFIISQNCNIKQSTELSNGLRNSTKLRKDIFDKFGIYVSSSLIRRYRRIMGFRWRRLRKAPYLTEAHKISRLIWCRQYKNADFSKYIFVDETMVRLNDKQLYHSRYPCSRPKAICITDKYDRKKVNVWGGISAKGATNFAVNIIYIFLISRQFFYLIVFTL